jgi:hypothetical protein
MTTADFVQKRRQQHWYTLENIMSNFDRPTFWGMIKFNQIKLCTQYYQQMKFAVVGRTFYTTRRSHDTFVTMFKRIVLKIRCRVPIACPAGKLLGKTAIEWPSVGIVCGSETIAWHSVGLVLASAVDWLSTYIGAIFIPYSYAHLMYAYRTVWRLHLDCNALFDYVIPYVCSG